jgi:tRNA(fMet)-specific endonuclease VapC
MLASGRVLLDTNIVIALLEGDETVLSHLDQAAEIFIPAIVLRELVFGAAKSGRPTENDIWIAATAKHHELVLVTRDRHFREVDDLRIADW